MKKKSYKYIVSVNEIIWDSVMAPNIKAAKRKATREVKATFKRMPKTRMMCHIPEDAPLVVEVESIKTFVG